MTTANIFTAPVAGGKSHQLKCRVTVRNWWTLVGMWWRCERGMEQISGSTTQACSRLSARFSGWPNPCSPVINFIWKAFLTVLHHHSKATSKMCQMWPACIGFTVSGQLKAIYSFISTWLPCPVVNYHHSDVLMVPILRFLQRMARDDM